ncbi:MAG: NADH-quinone oxidoreductase subunit H [Candidatus Melainabacteria bacterium]|nr:NADH-quinone oxidoreductase subunit H [Candidatus Melainabacteria bacterium]
MSIILQWVSFWLSLLVLPLLLLGVIRKLKARLQNRIGAPITQPFLNFFKLMNKTETISETSSWLFRTTSVINLASVLLVAFLAPWLSYQPAIPGDDLFLVIYLLALVRFFTILSSLDTASPFGTFSSAREATLSLLVEPAMVLSLIALALSQHSTSLSKIFAFLPEISLASLPLWLLAGAGLFISSLCELSRMPIDDPTTHLELTMVHEAMIIENSGKNLALTELSYALRMAVLFGLCAQCFLHALCCIWHPNVLQQSLLSVVFLFLVGFATALVEATAVKLPWRTAPNFIAYGLTMSLLAAFVAIAQGSLK